MIPSAITRRTLLKAGAAMAGTLALGGRDLFAKRLRAAERPTLVVFWLNGGPAGLFNSADAFLANGAFGVTPDNVRALGNGLYVDAGSLGTLPAAALAHMASVHFRHGLYTHNDARAAVLLQNTKRLRCTAAGDARQCQAFCSGAPKLLRIETSLRSSASLSGIALRQIVGNQLIGLYALDVLSRSTLSAWPSFSNSHVYKPP